MIKTVSIYSILFLILFTSCKNLFDKTDPRPLHLTNNSNRNVIFYKDNELSDINDHRLGNHLSGFELEPVKRNSTEEYRLFGGQWEEYLGRFPNGRMIVYVLDYDSAIKYRNITDTSQILKKQYLNMDTLMNNNWTLVYP